MSGSTEQKLKRRKLHALRRGVHRLGADEALPVSTHIVGIGKAGAGAIGTILRDVPDGSRRLSALAIDVGNRDLAELRSLAASMPERAIVETISIDEPPGKELGQTLSRYAEHLTLEYPSFRWGSHHLPWLDSSTELGGTDDHHRRAVAKAFYGHAYYGAGRPMQAALRRFAANVEAAGAQSIIAVVFGLGGGTGSGIAVDLARHLSSGIFGRRVLVVGIGIAPCEGDPAEQLGSRLFTLLNELDCLGDEGKNEGIVRSCGELFRNPFTAGFIVVPQQHVWDGLGDLAATHRRVDREVATLLTGRGGANLWEMLRLLNWVAAPSTQHSAARTPWGAKWIHMLGFADTVDGGIRINRDLPAKLGLLSSYRPEFIEVRIPDLSDPDKLAVTVRVQEAFDPEVAPQTVSGGRDTSVQFILPSIAKTDLASFAAARGAYDEQTDDERRLDHSMLLEQGIVLSEPSSRLDGMAGASLFGESWVAVPLADLRGDNRRALASDHAA